MGPRTALALPARLPGAPAIGASVLVLALTAGCGSDRDVSARGGSDPLPGAAAAALPAAPRAPLVTKVEHFYATAPDAERLFYFFRDTLDLAQVWPFQKFGDFASGGVSLGNVALELVREDWETPTEFAGIALEPAGNTDRAIAELRLRGIAHSQPDSNLHVNASGRRVGWVNTELTELDPWGVFLCDYLDRQEVSDRRRRASEELAGRQGGPLGVHALKEIVLGVTDMDTALRTWRRLTDSPAQESDGAFSFGPGPSIRLAPAASARTLGIVVQVRSLERARAFLAARRLLGEADARRVTIRPEAVGGLDISLVER